MQKTTKKDQNDSKKPKFDAEYGVGVEINYIVIEAQSLIKLAINVNRYLDKFPYFEPIGGASFIKESDGKEYFTQTLYVKDRSNVQGLARK